MDETPQVGQERAHAKITQTSKQLNTKAQTYPLSFSYTESGPFSMENGGDSSRQQQSWPKVTSRKALNKAKHTQKQHPVLPSQSG